MSYEKLKISVAVSLVLFIFLVGNIFVFGYLQKMNDTNHLKDKSQNTQQDLNTIILDNKKEIPSSKTITKEESKSTQTSSETTTQTKVSHTTQGTVKRHRITRAS